MGIFSKIFLGEDLDELQRTGDSLDARLTDLNRKDYAEGDYGLNTFNEINANIKRGATGDVAGQVKEEFDKSVSSTAGKIRGAVGETLNFSIGGLLKIVPWQVWLILAIYLAFQFGLLKKFIPVKT